MTRSLLLVLLRQTIKILLTGAMVKSLQFLGNPHNTSQYLLLVHHPCKQYLLMVDSTSSSLVDSTSSSLVQILLHSTMLRNMPSINPTTMPSFNNYISSLEGQMISLISLDRCLQLLRRSGLWFSRCAHR
jgi:hypothetical protein